MTNYWTQQEIDVALKMRDGGASSREIGLRLGRKDHAVRAKFKQLGLAQPRDKWLESHARESIEHCKDEERLIEDAVVGSWRLKVAILTAIVRQAA